jgi:transposase
MIKITLSPEEKVILKGYLKTSPLIVIRYKCQALLMREKGMKLKDIADIVSRDGHTIGRWIKDFHTRRMASIFSGHKDNENAGKLTKEEKQQIRETLHQPPSAHGLPKEFWDVPTLKEYVKAEFGVVYESTQSYHFLLKFSNLSFKYPDTFDHRRDNAYIAKRMHEIHKEIGRRNRQFSI